MANLNSPFGLKQLGLSGSPVTNFATETKKGAIDKDDTNPCYTGDLIQQLATGYWSQWTIGTGVSQAMGLFQGCRFYSVSQQTIVYRPYWPGTDAAGDVDVFYAPLINTPGSKFLIQSGPAGIAFADIGANADIVVGTGNTMTGQSGSYLSTVVTTATVPFQIFGLYSTDNMGGQVGPGTEAGAYNWVVVEFNGVQRTGLTT